jgi:hypothetical protein
MTWIYRWLALIVLSAGGIAAVAQEQIDKGDAGGKAGVNLAGVSVRARVIRVAPEQKSVTILWRHGGEGLGGTVTRGAFAGEDGAATIGVGLWSKPLPLIEVAGKGGGWRFPTIVVSASVNRKPAVSLSDVAVEFEFAEGGKVIKSFTETAPKGGTVGLAVPAGAVNRDAFLADLSGLLEHARLRHGRLAKLFPEAAKMPRLFGVIGHLAGYGEASGYGIRHSNPAIVKEETETLKLLGVTGLVGERSVALADAAGAGAEFRRVYWGGPGSGSPMGMLKKRGAEAEACPFDPALAKQMSDRVTAAIAEHKAAGASESWGLWWDEIGVAAKGHVQTCPRCRAKFVDYLKTQHVEAAEVGAKSWDEVKPYPIWSDANEGEKANRLAPAPTGAADGLRYYYTFRFMTEATAQLFVEPAKQFKAAGVLLYAMQGPTPSWAGHSLDWNEFYDRGANAALVFETSNRDPRAWQFESYLADIGRGICERHASMPMGVLVKPHRGAVAQRMLAVVARGARVIEWYTYGPDYAKGDSFSQSPALLENVARAARFLGANEELLYGAKPAVPARVAFCSPRSSEIWGKATDLGVTAFEDAKWVYIALRHAHIPVDVVSEQQLAEGKLDQYKAIYVVGPNLRNDAGAALRTWVEAGGTLWTDAMGLSRDEANQPAHDALTGLKDRRPQAWGRVEPYKATQLKPFVEEDVPPGAAVAEAGNRNWLPSVGREPLQCNKDQLVMNGFADGRQADALRTLGKGKVYVAGIWVGLTYSARVRRADFDMSTDFSSDGAHAWLTLPLDDLARPVITSLPTVEAVALVKDGHRSVALMNWAYRRDGTLGEALVTARDVKVTLRELGEITRIRSSKLGELKLSTVEPGVYSVMLPALNEIDQLAIE